MWNNETVSQFELRLRQAEKARLQVGCSPTSDFDLTLMLHTAVISHGYFGQKVKRESDRSFPEGSALFPETTQQYLDKLNTLPLDERPPREEPRKRVLYTSTKPYSCRFDEPRTAYQILYAKAERAGGRRKGQGEGQG